MYMYTYDKVEIITQKDTQLMNNNKKKLSLHILRDYP